MTHNKPFFFPILKTERLTLRQLNITDDHEIFSLRSNDDVNKYLGRKPSESINDARNFISIINENIKKNDSYYWAVTLNNMDKLIGTICLFNLSEDGSKGEIGYELLPAYQGKGIMQEALSKVVGFAFQHVGLKYLEAYTHRENESSTNLLEKLDFRKSSTEGENFLILKLIPTR